MAGAPQAGPRALLRHRAFARYLLAGTASRLAGQMLSVSVAWLVYDLTDSALALGLIGLAQFLPNLVMSLPAGSVADRFDRRRVIALCQAGAFACVCGFLALLWSGSGDEHAIYLLMALFAAVRTYEWPAYRSLLPALVPREEQATAIALNASLTQMAIVGGPALGGLLYLAGAIVVFAVTAALLALAIVLISGLAHLPAPQGPIADRSVLAGFAFIWREKPILGAVTLDLLAVLLGGATALLPIYARDILHAGPVGLGILRSAPAVGALLISLGIAWFPIRRHAGMVMFGGVLVFGLATIAFGLSGSFVLSLVALMVMGAADQVSVYVRLTLTTLFVPDQLRGRVSAANSLFVGGSNQLGEFRAGAMAALLSAVPAVVIGGIGTVAVALAWMALFPTLRRLGDLVPPAPR